MLFTTKYKKLKKEYDELSLKYQQAIADKEHFEQDANRVRLLLIKSFAENGKLTLEIEKLRRGD
ncbi:MAG: hypothetical protein KBT03_09755 [Bacteroidales bacterium]|nr:hypothetical protein [Candidatus Scybalousia scybalohippi]